MNELTKRAVAALLSGLLVLGQAGPALAAQDDSIYGPAFSTKVEQTSPGSSESQSGGVQSSGPQSVAPANAAPAEQADGGSAAAAGSTEAAAKAGTDSVSSSATDQNAAQAADDSAQADAEAVCSRGSCQTGISQYAFCPDSGAPSGYHMDRSCNRRYTGSDRAGIPFHVRLSEQHSGRHPLQDVYKRAWLERLGHERRPHNCLGGRCPGGGHPDAFQRLCGQHI